MRCYRARDRMRAAVVACALGLALIACKNSQPVTKAITCSEPCCGGDPEGVDCAENHELQCVEPDDACDAGRPFGCSAGVFFQSTMTVCEIEAGQPDAGLGADGGDLIVLPGDAAAPAEGAAETQTDAAGDATIEAAREAAVDAGPE